MGSHGRDNVRNGQYPRLQEDIFSGQTCGVAGTVHLFMVLNNDFCDRVGELDGCQDIVADLRVHADYAHLNSVSFLGLLRSSAGILIFPTS